MSDEWGKATTIDEIRELGKRLHQKRVDALQLLPIRGYITPATSTLRGGERKAILVSCSACGCMVVLHHSAGTNFAETRDALRSRFGWVGKRRALVDGGWVWTCDSCSKTAESENEHGQQ